MLFYSYPRFFVFLPLPLSRICSITFAVDHPDFVIFLIVVLPARDHHFPLIKYSHSPISSITPRIKAVEDDGLGRRSKETQHVEMGLVEPA